MVQIFILILIAGYHTKIFCGNLNVKQSRKSHSQEKIVSLSKTVAMHATPGPTMIPIIVGSKISSQLIFHMLANKPNAQGDPHWTIGDPIVIQNPTQQQIIDLCTRSSQNINNMASERIDASTQMTLTLTFDYKPIFDDIHKNEVENVSPLHSKSTTSKK